MAHNEAFSTAMDELGDALGNELKSNAFELMKLIASIRNSGIVYPTHFVSDGSPKDYVDLGQFVHALWQQSTRNITAAAQKVITAYNNGQPIYATTASSNKLIRYFKRGRVRLRFSIWFQRLLTLLAFEQVDIAVHSTLWLESGWLYRSVPVSAKDCKQFQK